jgi:glycosyltransferase involved in cell wall biosynthesis
MDLTNLKVAYLCLKGGPHPAHRPWVEALLNVANVQVVNLSRRFPLRFLSSSIYRRRYDLTIADGFSSLPVGWFMKKAGLCRKLAFITTSPTYIRFFRTSSIFLRDVDFVIAISSLTYLATRKLFNFNRQIIVCHPIPELSDFLKIEPSLGSKKVCFVGSFIHWKGADLLPKIIDKVCAKLNGVEFFIIGNGKLNELRDKDSMKVFGQVPHRELPKLLSECLVYVHPARFDCFPIAVIEAMAAGLIPVVTKMTGSKDLVKQVDPSLVVPVDVDAISAKIVEVLSLGIEEKETLSRRAKQVALEWSAKTKETFLKGVVKALQVHDKDALSANRIQIG